MRLVEDNGILTITAAAGAIGVSERVMYGYIKSPLPGPDGKPLPPPFQRVGRQLFITREALVGWVKQLNGQK